MTAIQRPLKRALGIVAAGFLTLPLPPPVPTPNLLPTSLPTPSLPVVLPTPSVPGVTLATPLASPNAAATPASSTTAGSGAQAGSSGGAEQAPRRGLPIPFTGIYVSSPLDVAVLGAFVTLPLLLAIWLLLALRTFVEARRVREAHIRLLLAGDLGMRPKDLTSVSTKALFTLREKSAFDELTGVLRRAAGISVADREIARARRHNASLAVAFIDIDGLREANARQSRAAGDAMLRGLTQALKEGLRPEDAVIRFTGDEFVCVLPDLSAKESRSRLCEIQLEAARRGTRFCFGVAELQKSDDVVSLFARADKDLYEFKTNRGEIVPLPTGDGAPRPDRTASA